MQPNLNIPDFDAIENMRKADRNERTVQDKDDYDEMDLDCDIDLGRDIGPERMNNNDKIVMRSNVKSRKRLDDISEDLSSIPSYDGGGRNARHINEEEADNEVEQMIFADI